MEFQSSFTFAQPSQPFHFLGLPPTPYADEDGRIGPKDLMATTFLREDPYDGYHFSTPLTSAHEEGTSSTSMMHVGSVDSGVGDGLDGMDYIQHGSGSAMGGQYERQSSSEEKESLTPAQSRRKAQNRAAQRAFRERKERHVKDLEAKITAIESSAESLAADNERLKIALHRATTENEILRASSRRNSAIVMKQHASLPVSGNLDPGYSSASHKPNERDGKMIAAGATWDLMQSHPLVRQGFVDIADVCERLQGSVQRDGTGPVFSEREIRKAVEESRRAGGDELI